jgi:hypothetical protein
VYNLEYRVLKLGFLLLRVLIFISHKPHLGMGHSYSCSSCGLCYALFMETKIEKDKSSLILCSILAFNSTMVEKFKLDS